MAWDDRSLTQLPTLTDQILTQLPRCVFDYRQSEIDYICQRLEDFGLQGAANCLRTVAQGRSEAIRDYQSLEDTLLRMQQDQKLLDIVSQYAEDLRKS